MTGNCGLNTATTDDGMALAMHGNRAEGICTVPGRTFTSEAMRKNWVWLFGILLFELWLLYSVPPNALSNITALRYAVDATARVAPVITNFDRVAAQPEVLRIYFAATLLLIIPKSVFFYVWLNSSKRGNYRHLVISPLTVAKPKGPQDFALEPIKDKNEKDEAPRSMASRITWSLAILLLGAMFAFVLLQFGFEVPSRSIEKVPSEMIRFGRGDLRLWFGWSVYRTLGSSLVFAIAACVIRDYGVLFGLMPSQKKSDA